VTGPAVVCQSTASGREHNDSTKHVVLTVERFRTAVRFRPPPPSARTTAPERGRFSVQLPHEEPADGVPCGPKAKPYRLPDGEVRYLHVPPIGRVIVAVSISAWRQAADGDPWAAGSDRARSGAQEVRTLAADWLKREARRAKRTDDNRHEVKASLDNHLSALAALPVAEITGAMRPDDMNLPGYRFGRLKGDRAGTYAVTVTGNWRITFAFEGEDATGIDLEDDHRCEAYETRADAPRIPARCCARMYCRR
jgi:plasmid maintenance system killer protein